MKTFYFKGVKIRFITGKESNHLTKHRECYIVGSSRFYSERNTRKFIEEIVQCNK